MRTLAVGLGVVLLGIGCAQRPEDDGSADESQSVTLRGPSVSLAQQHDASAPLMLMQPAARQQRIDREPKPVPRGPAGNFVAQPHATVQTTVPTLAVPSVLASFNGVGNGLTGPQGTFSVNSAPPDTNGDVGPNHYVQTVNSDFAIFSKTGTVLYGPVQINTLWSGFGGGCQTNNDGDPVVLYDPIADRWIITQFSVSTTPYLECVAVSQTPDPTGAYYRYAFSYGNTDFPDYPKLGVWPDAYYVTYNIFANAASFAGAEACAWDRTKMLTGAAATQQCFKTSNQWGGMLPSDLDGARLPPSGAPNYMAALGTNSLGIWKFHVDWTTPASSTFTGPTTIAVGAYTEACSGGTCVPQTGTTQKLDALSDRLMFRLAYRNFGDHESMVVNHSVTAGSSTGARWYELRIANGAATVFQQGTYAPDTNYRWMGSVAQDQAGNMALGFSTSSSTLHPEVRFTGRLAGDAAGTMTQGEGTIIAGAGSQSGSGLSRWGDYSMMSVDPTDDCTFWFTTEYLAATGAFNWSTRIGSFKLPGCGGSTGGDTTPPSTSITAPANGATVSGTVNVTAASSDNVGVTRTEIYVDGALKATATSFSWDTTAAANGSHTLSSKAYDAAGNVGTSATVTVTVSNGGTGDTTPPATAITAPANGATVSGTVNVTTSSSDNVGVTKTEIYVDGALKATATSFSWDTTAAANGSHALSSKAYDAAGNVGTSATVTVTVSNGTTGSGLVNGGFETGTLSGWTSVGTTAAVTGGKTGTYAARVGGTAPTSGDSSIAQTFTAPATGGTLSFAYKITCPDTVTYDWATATLKNNATGVVTTMVAKTCTNSGAWATASATLSANVSYTLTLISHDDNYTGDATYTLYDDVAIGTGGGGGGGGLTNGDFEAGTLNGWTKSGSASISTIAHAGTYAALIGNTVPTAGDSTIVQTFTVPSGATKLSLYYATYCPDTVTYDWATITLKNNTTGSTATLLGKTCPAAYAWTNLTATVAAGQSYTLTILNHDDNYTGDATYTLADDVKLQ